MHNNSQQTVDFDFLINDIMVPEHKPGTLYQHLFSERFSTKEFGSLSVDDEVYVIRGGVTMLLAVQEMHRSDGSVYLRTTHLTNTGVVVYRFWHNKDSFFFGVAVLATPSTTS